ncbi:unnamed protein product [Scytosiphon promiscuus]
MADSERRKRGCWLTDHADIAVPPSKEDFVMAGNLQKRRGGFGKMSQQRWKNRCFVLLKTGNLCYFQAGSFESVDFCDPPRGILTLDEDVLISKNTRPDGDFAGALSLVIQGGGQRWKLSSEAPGEIDRWEEALRSVVKGSASPRAISVTSMRSPTFDPSSTKTLPSLHNGVRRRILAPSPRSMNGVRSPSARAIDVDESKHGDMPSRGGWALACVLMAVDVVCYFLHQHEFSVEMFYAAVCALNLVVGWGMRRAAARRTSRDRGSAGVPLIHGDDVGPLRLALKRRGKKDPQPISVGDIGEITCGVPVASSTTQHYKGPPGTFTAPPHSWSNGISSVFRVRGKGYMQDRMKVPPADTLYDMVGFDIFSTEARVGNMASEVVLDSVTKDLPEVCADGVPPLLVINVQLPSAPPALMTSAEDGPGFQQCVLYFRIKDSTARAMENLQTASEGVRLWVTYCQRIGQDDDFHGRFKCIAVIANSESLGLPSFVTKYNGKPVLINRSGHWVKGENYIENTINVHRFSFIAKKSLHALKVGRERSSPRLGFSTAAHEYQVHTSCCACYL